MNGTADLYHVLGVKEIAGASQFTPARRKVALPTHPQTPQHFPGFGHSARQSAVRTAVPLRSPFHMLEPRAPEQRKSAWMSTFALAALLLTVYATFHYHLLGGDTDLDTATEQALRATQIGALDTPLKTQTVGLYSNGSVYQNPHVVYLKTLFTAYAINRAMPAAHTSHAKEFSLLDHWDNSYFRSRFVVSSLDNAPTGGSQINIIFLDNPGQVFQATVDTRSDGVTELRDFRALRSTTSEQMANNSTASLGNRHHAL